MSSCNGNHTNEELERNTRSARRSSTDSFREIPLEKPPCPIHLPKGRKKDHRHYLIDTLFIDSAHHTGPGTDIVSIVARYVYHCTRKKENQFTQPMTALDGIVTANSSYQPRGRSR